MQDSATIMMRRHGRNAVGALLSFVILTVVTLTLSANPAAATVVKIPMIHFNMAGGNASPSQIFNIRNIVVYSVVANSPYFSSLNEVCHSDWIYFNQHLAPAITWGDYQWTRWVEPDCNQSRYGIALYGSGSAMEAHPIDLPNPGKVCSPLQPDDVECRKGICEKINTYLGQMSACTTHLDSADEQVAGDQGTAYRDGASSWAPYSLRFLMGDFNLERTNPLFPPDFNTYDDLGYYGLTWSTRAPGGRTKQIDYIYWVNGDVTFGNQARSCTSDSDHCLIQTSVWITV
jgi:hypothetical protein